MNLAEAKVWIEQHVGLEQDALHVHVALLLYLLAVLLFRKGWRTPLPFLVVLGLELLNESYDLLKQLSQDEPLRYGESLKDVWNTMVWPTVLLLAGRFTNLFVETGQTDTIETTADAPQMAGEYLPAEPQKVAGPRPPSS